VVIGSAGGVLSVSVRSSRSAGPTVVAAMVGLWLCWGSSFPAIRVMVKTHLLVAVIARDDSPEFSAYWTPPVTNFDAEDAPAQIERVFDSVTVYPWDAPLVTLPDSAAVHDYLIGRQAPATVAAASRGLPAPLRVTKRGALILATRSQPDTAAVPLSHPGPGLHNDADSGGTDRSGEADDLAVGDQEPAVGVGGPFPPRLRDVFQLGAGGAPG